MEIGVIVLGLIAAFLVFKFIKGMVKFAILAALAVGGLYLAGVFN
jgi:hypothetical protein